MTVAYRNSKKNKGIYTPKITKIALKTDAKYVSNLVNVNMWL